MALAIAASPFTLPARRGTASFVPCSGINLARGQIADGCASAVRSEPVLQSVAQAPPRERFRSGRRPRRPSGGRPVAWLPPFTVSTQALLRHGSSWAVTISVSGGGAVVQRLASHARSRAEPTDMTRPPFLIAPRPLRVDVAPPGPDTAVLGVDDLRVRARSALKRSSGSRPRVAIVGAGPAGSTAARLLAERGADVRLFEARRLPRPKVCGGGLTPKAQRLVPPGALAMAERRVDRVELRGRTPLPPVVVDEPAATIAMVERARFDMALIEEAARAGAAIRDGEPIRELAEDEHGIEVRTARGGWQADVVVGADGEPSRAARQLGLGGLPRRRSLALEIDLPFAPALRGDTAILDYAIPGGYGWYFPKGDHANVGVGSYRPSRYGRLREDLGRLANELELDLRDGQVRGHWLAQGLRQGPLASRRAVLAGDAAATADAFFGEGISYALLSGVAAAQAIGDWADGSIDDLRPYDARLRATLGPTLGRLDAIARAAELSVSAALLGVRISAYVRGRAVDAIAGRRAPYVIDGHCQFACACALHGREPRIGGGDRISPAREPQHCGLCAASCAA